MNGGLRYQNMLGGIVWCVVAWKGDAFVLLNFGERVCVGFGSRSFGVARKEEQKWMLADLEGGFNDEISKRSSIAESINTESHLNMRLRALPRLTNTRAANTSD